MKQIRTFLLLGILISSNSCNLILNPVPFQEPFYCKINDKAFRPAVDKSPFGGIGTDTYKLSWDKNFGRVYISAANLPDYLRMTIKLEPNESIKAGTYQFTNDILLSNATYSYNETSEPKLRETMVSESGSITITEVSETKGKVWGTFEFKVKSKYLNKDFIITKGEFNGLGIYEVK